MSVRKCNLCGRMVDFSEPWCDHETMEESAWLDIRERQKASVQAHKDKILDDAVEKAANELMKKGNK